MMMPYNTGKYQETPEGIPMLHTIDHSLTETMFSLSPSSQFMYEQEALENTSCGQTQGSTGTPPVSDIKSEGIISPSVEGMTFEDYTDPGGLFSPPPDGLSFNDCFKLNENFSPAVRGLLLEDQSKQDDVFGSSGDGLDLDECTKLEQVFGGTLEGISYCDVAKTSNRFDVLSESVTSSGQNLIDVLIPSSSDVSGLVADGIGNDWFELDKDIYEMSKEDGTDALLQDPVFSGGPTLTQLNSKDLDSTCLDDYSILEDLCSFGNILPTSSEKQKSVSSVTKFPVSPGTGSVTSPKFTTCTVTSFVTTVSGSGTQPACYPTYIANELLPNQGAQYVMNGYQDVKPHGSWATVINSKSPLATTYVNPCFVPVVNNSVQMVDLVGTVVIPGASVSVMVSEKPSVSALKISTPVDVGESSKSSEDQKWEEIERLIFGYDARETSAAAAGVPECSQGQINMKTEPRDVTPVASEDLSDKEESMLEDSDVENTEVDNSDEESVSAKAGEFDDFATTGRKDKKYFWQYNTQSKGPKGKRLCKSVETEDPHVLHDFEDPVFDPEQNQTRYKHNGKARRGDGNDVTPNPHKLFVTGNELKKLNKLINNMAASSDMPASVRAKLLKEKNKYASRACRLKKKAQHEANKLKLHGLELEHRQLMKVLMSIKKEIAHRISRRDDRGAESMSNRLEALMKRYMTLNVAGHTADYVNSVLQKVSKGDRSGGISVED